MSVAVKEKLSKSRSSDPRKDSRDPRAPEVRVFYQNKFEQILKVVGEYSKKPDLEFLQKAYDFAYDAHIDQLRKSGVPYIEHAIETAKILADLRMDMKTVVAGILHDVVEDTGVTIEEVSETFGKDIGLLVDGVTKISELKFRSQAEKQAENFRKMIFSMVRDLRIIMIKFADRLHNMRTLEYLPKKKAERIALETRDVYAPLAHRFGIAKIKWELEDLSLKILNPEIYVELAHKIDERREEREKYIQKLSDPILKELKENDIDAEITGRAKSLYSIYKKMQKRNKPFEEIFDLLAIRIILNRIDECYSALGVVHTLFTPVHDRFKDYIATPKMNMYQSLHTTVIGPEGKMVEIQFRTKEMNRIAEIGIAAHWRYKEGKKSEDELDRYSVWLREMVDWQDETLDPEEYLDNLKTDLFLSEIFVFTPDGDLMNLPIGSTPVDFAFAIHTDVGFQCIGAKRNGKIVPLNTQLKSGDSVEIITSVKQKPSRDWLNFVKTSKAKTKIRQWIKEAELAEAIKLGEEIFSKGIKPLKIKYTKKQLSQIALEWGKSGIDQIYAELGQGNLSLQKVLEQLAPEKISTQGDEKKENIFEKFVSKARGSVDGIRVQGLDHLLIRFAQCCHPVPGDSIIGFISKGRGIIIHRRDCINAVNLMETSGKNIDVSWKTNGKESYIVQLRVLATGRNDFLKEIAEYLSQLNTNVLKIDMSTDNSIITSHMILEVKDLAHLSKIMRKLYRIKGVLSVERYSGEERIHDVS